LYPLQTNDVGTPFLITGAPLPPIKMYPAVALSGLVRYFGSGLRPAPLRIQEGAGAFPPEFKNELFSAQFNARKVVQHHLTRKGASFESADQDFLTTDDPDFHPSDVLEDLDGSLLVVDTGSWYTQHCPTGRIRNAPAQGGLLRVRYKTPAAPQTFFSVGAAPKDALYRVLSEGTPEEITAITRGFAWNDEAVDSARLRPLLTNGNAHVRLAAAEAFARKGNHADLRAVLDALARTSDRIEEHVLIYALQRLATSEDLDGAVNGSNPPVQAAALLLLDQAPYARLNKTETLSQLFSTDQKLHATAMLLLRRHPEWVSDAVGLLGKAQGPEQLEEFLATFISNSAVRTSAAHFIADKTGTPSFRANVLRSLASSRGLSDDMRGAIQQALFDGSSEVREAALGAVNRFRLPGFDAELSRLFADSSAPLDLRLAALHGLVRQNEALTGEQFEFLKAQARPAQRPAHRLIATDILSRSRLTPEQVRDLLAGDLLPISAALELPAKLPLSRELVRELLGYLERHNATPREDEVEALGKLASSEDEAFIRIQARVRDRFASQSLLLERYKTLLRDGNPAAGQALFEGKGSCVACHRVGQQGGLLGPDLTKIGAIRSPNDLLESVVLPSSTFAQGYEPYRLTLKNGDELQAVRIRHNDGGLLFRTPAGAEIRLAPDEILKIEHSSVSLMPEGLLNGLSDEETRDLFAYLQSLK
jgi:putative heme-binding domain-containing protein